MKKEIKKATIRTETINTPKQATDAILALLSYITDEVELDQLINVCCGSYVPQIRMTERRISELWKRYLEFNTE